MSSVFLEMREYDERIDRDSAFTLFDKFIFRPIGQLLASFLYTFFSVSPNQLTFISVIVTIVAAILLNLGYPVTAFGLFLLFPILDCADGSLARYLSTKGLLSSPYGELSDALGGYCFILIFWLSLGLFLQDFTVISFMCNLTCALNLISRLYYNKRSLVMLKHDVPAQSARVSRLYNIYENLEFGSSMLPIAMLSYYFLILEFFVMMYSIMAICLFIWCLRDFKARLR